MNNFNKELFADIAFAKVTGTVTGTTGAVINRGFVTITRVSTGVYTLERENSGGAGATVGADLPGNQVLSQVFSNEQTTAKSVQCYESTDKITTVKAFSDAGTAVDCDFTLIVSRATNYEGTPYSGQT